MPDITMCKGVGCEAKETCFRYTAKPNEYRQSYFVETPDLNGGCEYYINHNKLTPELKANIEKGANLFVKNVFPILKKLSKQ